MRKLHAPWDDFDETIDAQATRHLAAIHDPIESARAAVMLAAVSARALVRIGNALEDIAGSLETLASIETDRGIG